MIHIWISKKTLLKLIVIISFFQGIVSNYIGISGLIYLTDVLLILTSVWTIKSDRKRNVPHLIKYPIVAFLIISIISVIINWVPLINAIWGFRNYFRFYVFMLLIVQIWEKEDFDWLIKLFEYTFIPHMFLVLYQGFVLNLHVDNIGGIFGVDTGVNATTSIYCLGLLCIEIYKYYSKNISLVKLIALLGLEMLNAAIAEIKVFFFAAVILVVIYILLAKEKKRVVSLLLISVMAFPVLSNVINGLYQEQSDFFTLEYIIESITDSDAVYSTSTDIGRGAAIAKSKILLDKVNGSYIFGIGLGNADYSSSFSFLNSDFYNLYGDWHYTWLSVAFLFIEVGYLGLVAYIALFALILVNGLIRHKWYNESVYLLTILIAVACIILLIYNSSLRTNSAFLMFSLLPISYIYKEKMPKRTGRKNIMIEDWV